MLNWVKSDAFDEKVYNFMGEQARQFTCFVRVCAVTGDSEADKRKDEEKEKDAPATSESKKECVRYSWANVTW